MLTENITLFNENKVEQITFRIFRYFSLLPMIMQIIGQRNRYYAPHNPSKMVKMGNDSHDITAIIMTCHPHVLFCGTLSCHPQLPPVDFSRLIHLQTTKGDKRMSAICLAIRWRQNRNVDKKNSYHANANALIFKNFLIKISYTDGLWVIYLLKMYYNVYQIDT